MATRTRVSEQITGWVHPAYKIKERLRRLKATNPRLTESRAIEEAILDYLAARERDMAPVREDPAPQELKEEIPG